MDRAGTRVPGSAITWRGDARQRLGFSVTDQTDTFDRPVARIEPWGTEDLPLLMKLNDPQMTEHVGGPETPEKVVERQSRYEKEDSR